MEQVQLSAEILLDSIDVSAQVSRLVIVQDRPVTWKPGTAGSPPKPKAGHGTATVQLDFRSFVNDGTGAYAILAAAIATADGEVPFSAVYAPGAVSPTNQRWSGILVVGSLQTGHGYRERQRQSRIYPAYNITPSDS